MSRFFCYSSRLTVCCLHSRCYCIPLRRLTPSISLFLLPFMLNQISVGLVYSIQIEKLHYSIIHHLVLLYIMSEVCCYIAHYIANRAKCAISIGDSIMDIGRSLYYIFAFCVYILIRLSRVARWFCGVEAEKRSQVKTYRRRFNDIKAAQHFDTRIILPL